jgi:predicted house-cleaning noncanonical NTP pyrophosphatase (MazG superfamily)
VKVHNKLVRDKIPEIIAANGGQAVTKVLENEEYLQELIKKLGEEYEEFKADVSVEELADLQEVILALADTIANRNELEKVRAQKASNRGTFKGRIYLLGVNHD